MLSGRRLPDAVLFERTTDPKATGSRLPTGLELAVALGSPLAERWLEKREEAVVLHIVRSGRDLFERPAGIYGKYLHALAALLDPPDPAAPAVFSSRAWQTKSCNAALSGWAQMRHAFVLQAKEQFVVGGIVDAPAGFVEPNPEFFSRFGTLVDQARTTLDQAGIARTVSSAASPCSECESLLEKWHRLAGVARRLEAMAHKELRGLPWNEPEEQFLRSFGETLGQIMLYENNSFLAPRDDAPRIADIATAEMPSGALEYLHVGVGRPQAIYLLYPWRGRRVLCRGAVLPYLELRSETRLTDPLWRARLDGARPPSPPDWIRPILATSPPGARPLSSPP